MALDGLLEAHRVYRVVSGRVSPARAFRLLKTVTLYHRIQGSSGIVEAVEAVERLIVDEAPDIVEVESYSYTGRHAPEWFTVNAGWDVYEAVVEAPGSWRLRLADHPTLAAAHTPPSDGWVEGEVVRIEDPLDPSAYEGLGDKIALVTRHHRLAYRLAAEAGVLAVVFASPERHHDAAPYYGLFLSPEEAQKYTTVAVTLPWRLARDLEGRRLRLRVDADLHGDPGRVPVLAAWIGDRSAPGPVVTAHICHPAPGANDNASGVASAVEAFIALAEAVEEGALPQPGETVRLILIPEYTGTVLALWGWLGPLAGPAVNVDMVGRGDPYSGPHRILYHPVTAGPSRAGDTLYDVALATGTRLEYYMAGSDHDVYIARGGDAAMLNQWPDPFYHSSRDDADTISPARLATAAREAAAAAYLLASGYQPTGAARGRVVEAVASGHAARGDEAGARLAASLLALRLGAEPRSREPQWEPVRDDRVLEPLVPLPLAPLTRIGLEAEVRLQRRLSQLWNAYQVLLREAFYAAGQGYTVRRLHAELAAAYGSDRVTEEYIVEGLSALEEAGLLRLRG